MSADRDAGLRQRLAALRVERDAARRRLADLQLRRAQVLDTLLRLDVAVAVLEEELSGRPDTD